LGETSGAGAFLVAVGELLAEESGFFGRSSENTGLGGITVILVKK
jgi:hypothetical protein